MKYVPKSVSGTHNISSTNPLLEVSILSFSIIGILVLLYFALGLLIEAFIPHIPPSVEIKLGQLVEKSILSDKHNKIQKNETERVQVIVDKLSEALGPKAISFPLKVYVINSPEINAYALPGGKVIITSKLLRTLKTENAIAMVIGHEIGHIANKDNLRKLGRSVVFMLLASALLSDENSAALTNKVLSFTNAQYSQSQETKADKFGLDLLVRSYGSAVGATTFFEHMAKHERKNELSEFFLSHPLSEERVIIIKKWINEFGYTLEGQENNFLLESN